MAKNLSYQLTTNGISLFPGYTLRTNLTGYWTLSLNGASGVVELARGPQDVQALVSLGIIEAV